VSYLKNNSLSWQELVEALPDGTALIDERGMIRYVNELLLTLTGYERQQLVDHDVQILVPSRLRYADYIARHEYVRDPKQRLVRGDHNLTVLNHESHELSVDFTLSPITIDRKAWAVASIRDNLATKTLERAQRDAESRAVAIAAANAVEVKKSEQRFRLAFEDNMAPMVFTNREGLLQAVNDAFCAIVGRTRRELIGFNSKHFTHPDDVGISEDVYRRLTLGEAERVRYVKRFLHKDGHVTTAEVSISPARDESGETLYFVSSVRDVTEERALTAELSHQALHDPLTGLANRVLFDDRLAQVHARVLRQGGLGAVMLLDLDNFKGVNDTHGHLVGDQLLIEVARRFEHVSRPSDTLCRFGGDEFLYLAEGLQHADDAGLVASRFLDALVEPISIGQARIEQRASLGIVVWDDTSSDTVEIVQRADIALYEAKREGKGHHVIFAPGMHQQAVGRFTLEQDLHKALAGGELSMHYQPIVDLSTNEIVGFEALMRWQHPEQGMVPPNVFIPIAETSDLILDLGYFALRDAVLEASTWKPSDTSGVAPFVTVNFSARQFHDLGLVPMVEDALRTSGVSPDRLVLEITESVTLHNVTETMNVMERLIQLGIGFALDDFGTGYSSLSYLALLRPRIIKIDQSFVSPVSDSIRNDTLLEAIVTLGKKLNMTMLAEGIETPQQLDRLRSLGCELGQGYLFSPAVPAHQVPEFLNDAPWL
jgi:diguanylate cyclase (GGDEF)-like protein/PAS domain S-box-containing protein